MSLRLTYDLHMHSCLSPCADADMTPYNMVAMAHLSELQLIALTDHNSCRNVPAFLKHASDMGILALGGMELTCAEEIHVVCLFPSPESAEAFSNYVYTCLPKIKNRTDIFGEQAVIDYDGNITEYEEKLLISATTIGVYEIYAMADEYGGIAYPAHIERDSFSLLSQLGSWDNAMGFNTAELTRASKPLIKLPKLNYITSSDSHSLERMAESAMSSPEAILEIDTLSPFSVIDALKRL